MPDKPKLKRDWEGRYVRLKEDIETQGGVIFDVDEVMLVTRNHSGLHLERVHQCECCSKRVRQTVSKVHESYVELLPEGFEPDA